MIKTLILAGGILTALFSHPQDRPARLSGKILHVQDNMIFIGSGERQDTILLAPDGTFTYSKRLPKAELYGILIPKVRVYPVVFLENGKTTYIEIDVEQPQKIQIAGDLKEVHHFIDSQQQTIIALSQLRPADFKAYSEIIDQTIDSLENASQQLGDNDFHQYNLHRLKQNGDRLKTGFSRILTSRGEKTDSDPDYTAFMQSIDLNDEAEDSNLFAYLEWKASCLTGNPKIDYYEMLKVLRQEVTNPQVAAPMAHRLARIYLAGGLKGHIEEVYQIACGLLSGEQRKDIDALYTKITKSLAVDALAPDFEMMTPEGKKVKFSETWGKVIFIDIWSTWCGPCCKEIPYVAKLVEHYRDNPDIEFISISLDKNLDDWRKFLQNHHPNWKQFVIPEKQQKAFLQLYGIQGIPRFMAFTKEGRIVDTNAPRPSSEHIIDFLDRILK